MLFLHLLENFYGVDFNIICFYVVRVAHQN